MHVCSNAQAVGQRVPAERYAALFLVIIISLPLTTICGSLASGFRMPFQGKIGRRRCAHFIKSKRAQISYWKQHDSDHHSILAAASREPVLLAYLTPEASVQLDWTLSPVLAEAPTMRKHSLKMQVCLADLALMSTSKAVGTVFDLIDKVYAAVKAKSGTVAGYQYSNERDPVENIDGTTATLLFDVRTPYDCELALEFQHVMVNALPATIIPVAYPLLELKVTLKWNWNHYSHNCSASAARTRKNLSKFPSANRQPAR
jgi:hypothetical protein